MSQVITTVDKKQTSLFSLHELTETISRIAVLLKKKSWSLAVAESCTGGGLGQCLTSIDGSSQWFKGGVIAYTEAIKKSHLHISQSLLSRYGAVSQHTAEAMSRGVLDAFNVNVAISITGIAGPGGGTKQTPIGTIWIASLIEEKMHAKCYRFSGNRYKVRDQAVIAALNRLVFALDHEAI